MLSAAWYFRPGPGAASRTRPTSSGGSVVEVADSARLQIVGELRPIEGGGKEEEQGRARTLGHIYPEATYVIRGHRVR